MNYDLYISLVTFHTSKENISKLVESISLTNLKTKLFIVDNSSNDEIKNYLDDFNHVEIEYIFNNKNIGYGSGHNIVINKAINDSVKYHLVINPDIWFESDILSEIFDLMENDKSIGNVMPKIYYGNGEVQHLCKLIPSPMDLIFRRFIPIKSIKEKRNDKYELRFSGYDKIMNVPTLSGCFMFMRTDSLKSVGAFDERYFMYLEDVDLTRRIHEKYKNLFIPSIKVFHGYEKESYRNPVLLKYHIKSALKYFNKWGWFLDFRRFKYNKQIIKTLNDKQ